MAYGESTTADYDMATPANYTSNTLSSSSLGSGLGGATAGGNTMSKSGYNTMTSSYSYQVTTHDHEWLINDLLFLQCFRWSSFSEIKAWSVL